MKRKTILMLSTLFLLSGVLPDAAFPESNYWFCGPGSWTTDSCWSGRTQPVNGDNVYLYPDSVAGGYTITYDTDSYISLDQLDVGKGLSTVTLEITAPYASIDVVSLEVGTGYGETTPGFGAVVQEGGTVGYVIPNGVDPYSGEVVVGGTKLTLGSYSGDSGSYTLTGGSLFAATELIGDFGSGVFTHDGATGSNNTTHYAHHLYLGFETTGNGAYNLGAGELTSELQYIGYFGTGEFIQSSPLNSHNTTTSLTLGEFSPGDGAYTMMGGWLTAGSETIGHYGAGTFTQWDGINSISGDLTMASGPGSSGAYSMMGALGGNPVLTADNVYVGMRGEGEFTQDGGSITAANEYIGYWGTGTFTQSNGTNTVSGALYLGHEAGSSGTYNLSGPGWSSVLQAGAELVGHDGNGHFNQSGGLNQVSTNLHVGSGIGTGEYNLSGGTLSAGNENIGTAAGFGVFNQTSGSNSVNGALTIGANGTYNLNSAITEIGTGFAFLDTATIVNNGTVNYSGGYGIITANGGNICSYCGTYDPNQTTFENNGTLNISGEIAKTINANITNNGTVNAVNTNVTFNGVFINNGEYFSDPSSSFFNDLIVNSTGYLVGGTGDNFFLSGDFMNYSTQTAFWNTMDSYLDFTGLNPHEFYLAGWDTASSMSFSWDTLELGEGGSLLFSGAAGASLYVDNLILSAGSTLNLNGFNLYYYSLTDLGGSYYGGELINLANNDGGSSQVPEPSTILLLVGGMAGLAGFRRFYR